MPWYSRAILDLGDFDGGCGIAHGKRMLDSQNSSHLFLKFLNDWPIVGKPTAV